MNLNHIKNLTNQGNIKWSSHCLEKMGERDISIEDVLQCILSGEIIEEYPDDYPHPSCLLYKMMPDNRTLHAVIGFDEKTVYAITAYYPNTIIFNDDLKTRRK